MARKDISEKVLKQLFALCRDRCAFPGCKATAIEKIDGQQEVMVEVCHIVAAEDNGPRANPSLSDEYKASFDNLLLMCASHHNRIDRFERKYTVEKLHKIKSLHEAKSDGKFTIDDDLMKEFEHQVNFNVQNIGNNSWGIQNTGSIGNVTIILGSGKLEEMGFRDLDLPKLIDEASHRGMDRTSQFTSSFFVKNSDMNVEDKNKVLQEPEKVAAIIKGLSLSTRKSELSYHQNLADLLARHLRAPQDFRSIVYEEAMSALYKLTDNQVNILALAFALKYKRFPYVSTVSQLREVVALEWAPFINFEERGQDYQHLDSLGCASVAATQHSFAGVLKSSYTSIYMFPFDANDLATLELSQAQIGEIFEEQYGGGYRLKYSSLQSLVVDKDKLKLSDKTMEHFHNICERKTMDSVGILNEFEQSIPGGKAIYEKWDKSSVSYLSLTTTGIAIAISHLSNITDQKIDDTIWIN